MTREELDAILRKSGGMRTNIFFTKAGDRISLKEFTFINEFMATGGDIVVAVQKAGFPVATKDEKHFMAKGKALLAKPYIYNEIIYRMEEMEAKSVADATEIMTYFTNVMRGEIKDQFGLDAPLSERTSAARELAKRIVDIPAKASEADRAIKIELDWKRPDANETTEPAN